MALTEASGAEKASPAYEYLSSLQYRFLLARTGWGQIGIDRCAHPSAEAGLPLRIGSREYERGLGHHADGEIIVELEGMYTSFEAEVGLQPLQPPVGSVVFRVIVDGRTAYDSGVIRPDDEPVPVSVDLAGADELRLVVSDAGDGITCDCANWADARLARLENADARPSVPRLDVAPFGRVVTWDPKRKEGSRANRVQEFHEEDVYTERDLQLLSEGYKLPAAVDGKTCIGLQWLERRRLGRASLEFNRSEDTPAAEDVSVEIWVGESAWQGGWQELAGAVRRESASLVLDIDHQSNPEAARGFRKLRWILPGAAAGCSVSFLGAVSRASVRTDEIVLEAAGGGRAQVEVYNGEIMDPPGKGLSRVWDTRSPLRLTVRWVRPGPVRAERSTMRLKLPADSFAFALDDVVGGGGVYVEDTGFFAGPAGTSREDYLRANADKETVLERVRKMPDQTLGQALSKTRNPAQDAGPVMLSLARHNSKFIVHRNGSVQFQTDPETRDQSADMRGRFNPRLDVSLGDDPGAKRSRRMHGDWLPVPEMEVRRGSVTYTQRAFVAPVGDGKSACVVEIVADNTGNEAATAAIRLAVFNNAETQEVAHLRASGEQLDAVSQDRLLLQIRHEGLPAPSNGDGAADFQKVLQPGERRKIVAVIPGWVASPSAALNLPDHEALLKSCEEHWNRELAGAAGLEIPDELLANVIRASQVHCLMAARNEEDGERVAPWIASWSYGPLESEANSIIRGMSLLGHDDFARRSLDFFIHRYNQEGFLTTGYTVMGTGWHLWTLGRHFALDPDEEWLRERADEVARVCRWVVDQTRKTRKLNALGEKPPEYGLMPPGVMADWNAFAYYFYMNGYYYAGLKGAGEVLTRSGHPEGPSFVREAEEYRKNIVRAFRWIQERSPVVPLSSGDWVKPYPSQVHSAGKTADFFPGEDANRSWAYDVELGSHHLVPHGVLGEDSAEAENMINHMEDVQFLSDGWFDYPAERSRADWFNLGGFAKVQPYYCRIGEIYAMRAEAKPFLRTYFNSLASLLNLETLWLWEHFNSAGAWNKTHETGYFLQQTRHMLLTERGSELWLAPLVPQAWLADGLSFGVEKAPSRFGDVTYRVRSHIGGGWIEADVNPPDRQRPESLVLRLRHPEGRKITRVSVNGQPSSDFDADGGLIRLPVGARVLKVRVDY